MGVPESHHGKIRFCFRRHGKSYLASTEEPKDVTGKVAPTLQKNLQLRNYTPYLNKTVEGWARSKKDW